MTIPEHVTRWWGILDDKHSLAVCEIDVRVGGAWRFVGRGPEGETPAFYGVYREIAPPERLVYTENFEPFPDPGRRRQRTPTIVKAYRRRRASVYTVRTSRKVMRILQRQPDVDDGLSR